MTSRLNAGRTRELANHYRRLESALPIQETGNYERLVVPNGNGDEPVHRWFRMKEAYSAGMLPRVVKDTGLSGARHLRLLDPFAGSGTTAVASGDMLLEGALDRVNVTNYECNPFLHLIARTKLAALQGSSSSFLSLARKLAAGAAKDQIDPDPSPQLATLRDPRYFAPADLRRLLQLRKGIEEAQAQGRAEPLDIDILLLCLGSTIEPVSALRRDGRALRYVPGKLRSQPIAEFIQRVEQVQDDIQGRQVPIEGHVYQGDGRYLQPKPPRDGSIDLALFSPPYPNNIDYTEVYKLESWLLGLISTPSEFREQRRRTVHSHPSVLREVSTSIRSDAVAMDELAAPLLACVPSDRYLSARRSMISGYLRDMADTFGHVFEALRPGGHLVFVVGNSLHGTPEAHFVIAADLLLATIARNLGFIVDSLEVARIPTRRHAGAAYLRESVIFLHRPGA